MTVCDWAGWAQSQKCPLCKSWVQMWWRSLSTCVTLPSTPSLSALSGVPAEPGQLLRAQGCPEHSSVLSATPSPHSLMDTHCRGTSAANSQWPTRKCQDNLWFHFCPSWFLSWLGSWFQCCPMAHDPRETEFSLTSLPYHCLLPDPSPHNGLLCGKLLENAEFGIVSDWKPQITHYTLQSPLLEPLTNLTRSLQKDPQADSSTSQDWGKQRLQQEGEKSDK